MQFGYFLIWVICMNYQAIISRAVRLTSIVKIQSGNLRGIVLKNVLNNSEYAAFLGIPYAEPPLGENRFLPPIEIKPWTDIYHAVRHGSVCPQMFEGNFIGDENCLYLNVYTPRTSYKHETLSRYPVMVWIHGGAFLTGSGNSEKFGPDFLLDKDVVLVTFNYRLGPIGFLNLKHQNIPGNAGLKDQILVLNWVKKNIVNFGGNPNKVTIFGQSAGAVSVDLHNIAHMSNGLYKRSIAMSGSVFCPWGFMTAEEARNHALRLAKELSFHENKTDEMVHKFQNAPIQRLVKHAGLLSSILELQLPYVPSIESVQHKDYEPYISECFINAFRNGTIHKGEHIMGFTSLEAGVAVKFIENKLQKTVHNVINEVTNLWHHILSRHRRGIRWFNKYLKESSELMFSTGIDLKQKFMLNKKIGDIYYYYFNYTSKDSILNGVIHTEDLKYIFYRKEYNQSLQHFKRLLYEHLLTEVEPYDSDPDALTRNRMVTMLTNFAKFGQPIYRYITDHSNMTTNIEWLPSNVNGGYLDIGQDFLMKQNLRPISERVEKWQIQHITDYTKKICVPNVRPNKNNKTTKNKGSKNKGSKNKKIEQTIIDENKSLNTVVNKMPSPEIQSPENLWVTMTKKGNIEVFELAFNLNPIIENDT